jgi:hypothetical protein
VGFSMPPAQDQQQELVGGEGGGAGAHGQQHREAASSLDHTYKYRAMRAAFSFLPHPKEGANTSTKVGPPPATAMIRVCYVALQHGELRMGWGFDESKLQTMCTILRSDTD